MSEAGRRRTARARPALSARRLGARATAALTVLTLGAAVAVPVSIAPAGGAAEERAVRGAAAGALVHAPTDQIRSREWHLDVLRAQKAWKYSKGRGVTVAVLDTGVDKRHPDLTGNVLSGPDLTGGVRRPGTRYWGLHGTSMASIISGHGHGPGLSQGMMGVAPLSKILSIRVTLENDDPLRQDNGQQTGTGDRDAVAQGIRYAVDHGADIINMSLGGGRQFYNGTKSQESAIKYALGRGVILIASAGNDGSGANRKNFPAAYPGVIAVGALDRELRLWKDSNRRSHVSVCAPGVDIVSADASNGYVVGTGTSASSAMVAGVSALVRSRYPKLSPDEVRQALIQGSPARPGHPTGAPTCRGTVDALRALYAAHKINKTSSGPVETPPPSATPTPVARNPVEDSGLLLPLVLGGGGLLVILGLILGWRQRRPQEENTGDTDAVPDYGLPSAPPAPRQPAAAAVAPSGSAVPSGSAAFSGEAAAPSGEGFVPVSVPLWQSTDVYRGPPLPEIPPQDDPSSDGPREETSSLGASPVDGSPVDGSPVDGSWAAPSSGTSSRGVESSSDLDESPSSPPEEAPGMPHELRPFVPGEHSANGRNGQSLTNGHDFGNGHQDTSLNGLNGSGLRGTAGDEASAFDDDEWEAFRRKSLDLPPLDESTGTFSAVPPPEPADAPRPADPEPPPGPVPPMDQADDKPRGRHSRRPQPSDDEDYRPPWW